MSAQVDTITRDGAAQLQGQLRELPQSPGVQQLPGGGALAEWARSRFGVRACQCGQRFIPNARARTRCYTCEPLDGAPPPAWSTAAVDAPAGLGQRPYQESDALGGPPPYQTALNELVVVNGGVAPGGFRPGSLFDRTPFETWLDSRDPDNECPHGHLPVDGPAPCGCFARAATKTRRLSASQAERRAAAVDLAATGKSSAAIAAELGVHRVTVGGWLAEAGRRQPRSKIPDVATMRARAVELHSQGATGKAIAAELGVAQTTVSGWLRAEGLGPGRGRWGDRTAA